MGVTEKKTAGRTKKERNESNDSIVRRAKDRKPKACFGILLLICSREVQHDALSFTVKSKLS